MNVWTKMGSFFLAIIVLAVSAAACSGNTNNNEPAKPSSTTKTAEGTGSETKAEPVTLRVEIFDRGNTPAGGEPPDNNNWTRWVQEQFGDPNNIKMEYITVPRSEEVSKLNILMAADEAPDVVFTYDRNVMLNYVASDGLAKLDEALKQYGPNLTEFLGQEVLDYGIINGAQYAIPAKRPLLGVGVNFIRKDWLDALKLEVPATRDELYTVLKAFKEMDPGKLGNKVVPFSVRIDDLARKDGINAHVTYTETTEEDFYVKPEVLRDDYKENIRFFNKLYNEGLLTPNFIIDKDGKLVEQEIIVGNSGMFANLVNILFPGGMYAKLQENVPTAELAVVDPFENGKGEHPKWLYDPIGAYHMIPKSSENVKEAIMYLDWISKPDVLYTLQNGIEGEHFTKNAEGFPVPIVTDETKKTFYNTGDISMIAIGKFFGDNEKNIEGATLAVDPRYQQLARETIINSHVDGYFRPIFPKPILSEAKNSVILQQKLSEVLVKIITAKPEQFDKLFDEGIEEYMAAGGTEIMEEKKIAYAELKK